MKTTGYYEITQNTFSNSGLKAYIIAGNIMFNRMHWHDHLEIIYCVRGRTKVNIQGEIYELSANDLVTVGCGLSHEIISSGDDGLQLIFSADASLLRRTDEEQYVFTTAGKQALPKDHPDIITVRQAIAQMALHFITLQNTALSSGNKNNVKTYEYVTRPLSDECWYELHMYIYQILLCLSRHKKTISPKSTVSRQYHRFVRCIEFIHDNYQTPVTIQALAQMLGFSEPTIYRLFSGHMGITFNHYLNMVRIQNACGLIENTRDINVLDISAQCGFSSLSNFYRAFHQFAGMSPRAYKKACEGHRRSNFYSQQGLLSLNQFIPVQMLDSAIEEITRQANPKQHIASGSCTKL